MTVEEIGSEAGYTRAGCFRMGKKGVKRGGGGEGREEGSTIEDNAGSWPRKVSADTYSWWIQSLCPSLRQNLEGLLRTLHLERPCLHVRYLVLCSKQGAKGRGGGVSGSGGRGGAPCVPGPVKNGHIGPVTHRAGDKQGHIGPVTNWDILGQ